MLLELVRLAVRPAVRVDWSASIRLVIIYPMASCNFFLISWSSDSNDLVTGSLLWGSADDRHQTSVRIPLR